MALANSPSQRVISAMHSLRSRFKETVRMDDLAEIARMSTSAYYRQFRALTSRTPLQYQKQLRLLEARRLMVSQAFNVEAAALEVGYESPSQFSREYARMFSAPPKRDMTRLRTLFHADEAIARHGA
jgi:transcriptional regulator GlxA family with amidase domain